MYLKNLRKLLLVPAYVQKRFAVIKMRKLCVVLLFTGFVQISANAFSQKITLSETKASLGKILKKINTQTGYLFFYDLDLVKKANPINIHVKDASLEDVLDACFKDQPLQYTISNKIIIIMQKDVVATAIHTAYPVSFTISGTVKDESGKPLANASIKLKAGNLGTTADEAGNFSLNVPDAGGTLVVSFIGYKTREYNIRKQVFLSVVLLLEEIKTDAAIVMVGYGTQRKKDLTGALSTVNSKDFENQPVTRLDQALQGRATGVEVTTASGSPGGDVRIRIRGSNSLTGENTPLYVVDGFVGADFNNVNAEDIASIVVLKDASSTAIYGSRGANGVILISTKTGKKGAMQVDFMTRLSSSKVIEKYKTLNAADFATIVNARALALTPPGTTYTPRFTDAQIQSYKESGGTNWQDQIFRTGMGHEYQLGFSGGSDKTSYRINGNYLSQNGIITNSDFKRYSIRSNITSQISNKLVLRFNFAGTRRENHNTSGTGARNGVLGQALAWAPTTPVYDTSGNYTLLDPTSSIFYNPVATAKETDGRDEKNNVNLLGSLRYSFTPELTLDVQFAADYTSSQYKGFSGPAITGNNASAYRSFGENILLQNTNNLTYKKLFNNVHSLEVTGVFETQKYRGTGFNVGVNGLIYPTQSYNNLALSTASQVNSGYGESGLLSLLGRVNYAFKDKYLLSGSVRRDGSSKFHGANKYSVFPSAAVAWKLSEENFMKNVKSIDNLKLRASWGLTGNQGISPYGTLSAYTTNLDDAGAIFNGASGSIVSGIALGNPGNPSLKWETTEQINAGIDAELLKGLLTFSIDYFTKKTRNLLLSKPLPGYLGGYSILSNVGNMENKGWEFALGINAYKGKVFSWNSNVSLSFVKNKLVSLGSSKSDIQFNQFILRPGSPIGSFYGYKYLGTYKPSEAAAAAVYNLKPGDAHYADVNGDGVINEKDYQIIGNALPTTSLGWNNTFTYKTLTLNIFFQGLFGMNKLNYSYAYGMLGSTDAKEILFTDIKNRYIPGTNETSNIPAFSGAAGNSYAQTSRFIENASFVRLKNVSISYQIKKEALHNLGALTIFAGATNLLTFTHYKGIDPESNSNQTEGINWSGFVADTEQGVDQGAYPNSKTYTVGVKIIF